MIDWYMKSTKSQENRVGPVVDDGDVEAASGEEKQRRKFLDRHAGLNRFSYGDRFPLSVDFTYPKKKGFDTTL